MSRVLYIIGAGSVGGHVVLNHDLYNLDYEEIFFLDDDPKKIGSEFYGHIVRSNVEYLFSIEGNCDVIIGIAFPSMKKSIHKRIEHCCNLNFISLIAQNAWLSKGVAIGKGSIVYPNSSINYGSVIEDFVVINMNCALGHHAHIGAFTSLAPGVNLGGHTHVGRCVDVGIGVSTIQGVKIGDNSIVAGQAMVTKSFDSHSKLVGVPARNVNES